jgi:hypothetical protein
MAVTRQYYADCHLQHFTMSEGGRAGHIHQWRQFDAPTLIFFPASL